MESVARDKLRDGKARLGDTSYVVLTNGGPAEKICPAPKSYVIFEKNVGCVAFDERIISYTNGVRPRDITVFDIANVILTT
jgi:hypothetical protein